MAGYPPKSAANFTLLILMLIYVSNQWSRYLLNYLYAVPYSDDDDEASKISIADACSLTTSEYGLLTGYGFSATFVVTGLFMGRMADSHNRRNIICVGAVIWNCALAAMGMSSVFWELLVFRLVLGFGQAFSNPASYSMLADLFAPAERARANGIFAAGVYVGGGLASVSELIAEGIGWRETCYLVAIIGAGLALALALTTKEPARVEKQEGPKKAAGEDDKMTTTEAVHAIVGNNKVLVLLTAASFRYMGGYAIAGYLPYMYDYVFTAYSTEYSINNAWVVACGGFLSSFLGGKITTMWIASTNGDDKPNYYVPAIGAVLGCPFIAICCLADNFYVSIFLGLFIEYLVAECWFGPYMAALQSSVPSGARGLVVSTMMFVATFFGSLISYLIGVVYDKMVDDGYDDKCVRYIVLYAVVGCYLIAASLFYLASTMSNDPAPPKKGSSESSSLLAGDEEAQGSEQQPRTRNI